MSKEELIDWSLYQCYEDGRIYSKYYQRLLKGDVTKYGYVQVRLKCTDGNKKVFFWHRVIWTHFNGTIPEGLQVNHINEDKTDNRLCNLNLMTPKENTNWGTGHERAMAKQRGVPRPHVIEQNKRLFSKAVVAVDNNNVVYEFHSTREAERHGFNHSAVAACCRKCYMREGNNIYKNLRWYYKEDYLRMIKGVA